MAANLEIRPWDNFLEKTAFEVPPTLADAQSRINSNIQFYRGNYAVISVVVVTLSLYFTPALFWVIAIPAAIGGGLFLAPPGFAISGHVLTDVEKYAATAILFVVSTYVSETAYTLYSIVFLVALIVLGHSAMRKKSIRSKVSNFVDTSGVNKLGGEINRLGSEIKRVGKDILD
jgi:hypothetical protein